MNILVIGNGFDLAHGLPTKYTDFLFFCSVVKKIIKDNEIEANIPYDIENYNKWLEHSETLSFKDIDKNIYIVNFQPKNYKIRER